MNLIAQANQASLSEAAELLGTTKGRLRQAIKAGFLSGTKRPWRKGNVGRQECWVVDLEDVEAYLSRTNSPRRDEMANFWNDGRSIEWIAAHMEVKPRSVARALQRAGIKTGRAKYPD